MTDLLRPHERLDDLVLDGMKLIQRDDQFCFSIDTVLLAISARSCAARLSTWGRGRRHPPHLTAAGRRT